MKKLLFACCVCLVLGTFLIGCTAKEEEDTVSEAVYNETTIFVDKKGKVSETIVENFDKEYYNVEELKSEMLAQIDEYNSTRNETAIKMTDVKLENNKVFVSIDFNSCTDYMNMLGEDLFYGTIDEAYDNGYKMDVTLKGTLDGKKISKVEIMGMKDKHILIVSEHAKVVLKEKIAYVSANVDVLGEKEARVLSESGGLAYMILEK